MKLKLITAIALITTSIFTSALLASPTATISISGSTTVCKDAIGPEITLTGAGGVEPYTFKISVNGVGATQLLEYTSNGNSVTLPDLTRAIGTFTYTLMSVSDARIESQLQTGSVTFTVNGPTVSPTSIHTCVLDDPSTSTREGTVDLTSVQNTVNNASGNTFTWFSDFDLTLPISNPNSYTAPSSTVYVKVTNTASGCTNSEDVNIIVGLTPFVYMSIDYICVGQTKTLPYFYPYSTIWDRSLNTNIATLNFAHSGSVTGISVGQTLISFTAYSSDQNCPANGFAEVNVEAPPTATISGTTEVNKNATEPEITFTGVGGRGPLMFTYNINGGTEQTSYSSVFQSTATPGTFVYNLVKVEDANGCSQVQIGSATITVNNAVLTIELLNFKATAQDKANKLNWETTLELNNQGFDIERSADAIKFEKIGFVKAKGQNSTYDFADDTPLSISYYRLRQKDFDGSETLSKIITLKKDNKTAVKVYPNPTAQNSLQIDFGSDSETADIQVFNWTGQLLLSSKNVASNARFDVSSLASGSYLVEVKLPHQTFRQSFVKN